MDEKPDGWNHELYDKLSFEYLIKCAGNKRIDEWNTQYWRYLESEWNRLYLVGTWDTKNVFELVMGDSQIIRPDFSSRICDIRLLPACSIDIKICHYVPKHESLIVKIF